jgi:hypothetical protein
MLPLRVDVQLMLTVGSLKIFPTDPLTVRRQLICAGRTTRSALMLALNVETQLIAPVILVSFATVPLTVKTALMAPLILASLFTRPEAEETALIVAGNSKNFFATLPLAERRQLICAGSIALRAERRVIDKDETALIAPERIALRALTDAATVDTALMLAGFRRNCFATDPLIVLVAAMLPPLTSLLAVTLADTVETAETLADLIARRAVRLVTLTAPRALIVAGTISLTTIPLYVAITAANPEPFGVKDMNSS